MTRSFRVSKAELQRIKNAIKTKGWTQEYLAGAVGCSRQVVNNFFARRPVEKRFFQDICTELDLEWGEIMELEEEQSSIPVSSESSLQESQENTSQNNNQQRGSAQELTAPAAATTEQNATCTHQAIVVLSGKLIANDKIQLNDSITEIEAVIAHLKKKFELKVDLTIDRIDEGSVRITLGGSPEDLEKLQELFRAGKLNEVLGIPVEDVQLIARDIEEDSNTDSKSKSRITHEIVTQGAEGRDLSGANLMGAYLSRANLSRAKLIGANLIRANLSRANLMGAYLSRANLSGANLSGANLSRAYLSDANLNRAYLNRAYLSDANLRDANLNCADLNRANLNRANLNRANLSDANLNRANLSDANLSEAADVKGARLGSGLGLTDSEKQVLESRGAIFDDLPGDRSSVYSPVNR